MLQEKNTGYVHGLYTIFEVSMITKSIRAQREGNAIFRWHRSQKYNVLCAGESLFIVIFCTFGFTTICVCTFVCITKDIYKIPTTESYMKQL